QRAVVECPTQDSAGLQHLRFATIESGKAKEDRVADGVRDPHRLKRALLPPVSGVLHLSVIQRFLEHFLKYERVTLGTRVHQLAELRFDLLAIEDRRDDLSDLASVQGRERDELGRARATPALQQ